MPGLIKLNIHDIFPKISMIGFGNIAAAIGGGLMPLLDMKKFQVSSPSLCDGTRSTHFPVALNNCDAARGSDLIFLGTKPKDILTVCREIAPVLKKGCVLTSMAAGISIDSLQSSLPPGQKIIRIMPNTPVKEQLGIIALAHTANIPSELISMVTAMLETVGQVILLDKEEDMHSFTGLFGSGPAYMFLILQYLEEIADQHGLMVENKEQRRRCLIQLMKGSSVLLENSNLSFEAARRQVTSPNGTTHAGVTRGEALGLKNIVSEVIGAATERSKEMGKENAESKVSQVSVFKPGDALVITEERSKRFEP